MINAIAMKPESKPRAMPPGRPLPGAAARPGDRAGELGGLLRATFDDAAAEPLPEAILRLLRDLQ